MIFLDNRRMVRPALRMHATRPWLVAITTDVDYCSRLVSDGLVGGGVVIGRHTSSTNLETVDRRDVFLLAPFLRSLDDYTGAKFLLVEVGSMWDEDELLIGIRHYVYGLDDLVGIAVYGERDTRTELAQVAMQYWRGRIDESALRGAVRGGDA